MDAFEKFVFLSQFLGVHVVHHFYLKWERKVIKAFSSVSFKSNLRSGGFQAWRRRRRESEFSFVNAVET